jgi:molybdate transport system ATP-binding protein
MGVEMTSPDGSVSGGELSVCVRKRFAADRAGREDQASDSPFVLDVKFSAVPGFTILLGASGAGKTTLLDCIAGLQTPDAGRITIAGEALFDPATGLNLPPNRRSLGYLLQSLALFPHMTVQQNVEYGLHGLAAADRKARSGEILESFRIAGLATRRPAEISGGERQRVALARTLVLRPRALLLDEPLTALDARVKSLIVDDLRAWNQRRQIPILYVTHQREEVFALGEHVLAFDRGHIVAQGSPLEVLQRPQAETVAQLAGFENVFDCTFVTDHPEQGTMTCRIAGSRRDLEAPLARIDRSRPLRIGIRAGDILLASSAPAGLSARNVCPGTVESLEQQDVMVIAKVNSGATFEAHITPVARESLQLRQGSRVWLVVKTYSCQVWQGND